MLAWVILYFFNAFAVVMVARSISHSIIGQSPRLKSVLRSGQERKSDKCRTRTEI
jgi:hypothetical protein